MLDALSDFWKPMKKQSQEKLQPEQLQIGSSIGFGFVPQASLNGRRLQISGVNTYQFGEEALTSFVLTPDKDSALSMIVAESEGEQYLAISRRIPINDRMKMFESAELEQVMENEEVTTLPCKDTVADLKGWMVPSYKREIKGLAGRLFKGDFRKTPLPAASQAQDFKYTLLVSENNEHAIEIEKYADGRIELYATVYRRTTDIGEIMSPARPDLKLASNVNEAPEAASKPVPSVELAAKPEPIKLQEFAKTPLPAPEIAPAKPEPLPVKPEQSVTKPIFEEKKPLSFNEAAKNGAATVSPTFASVVATQPTVKQEVMTVTKTINGMDNEAIECDLRVANKIIDEAIRNEMRLSDVVRRIVELPVAHQEAVHIPVTLSDEDYALLAIRYGISSTDRNSIKKRILEDLNSFSGGAAMKKAA